MFKRGIVGLALVAALLVSAHQAQALDIQEIMIFQGIDRTDGVVDGYFFEVEINGTGINDGVVVNVTTGVQHTLTVSPSGDWADWWEDFTTMPGMLVEHPNPAWYQFYFNWLGTSYQDATLPLLLGATPPTGFANITNPQHLATGVGLNPTYTWDSINEFGDAFGAWVEDVAADDEIYENAPDYNMTQTSWQPGLLEPGKDYEIEVSVFTITGGAPYSLLTALGGDPYTYYGLFEEANLNEFTTAIPEPASLALVGIALPALIAWRRRTRMVG